MPFSSLASNQMVDESNASTGGFTAIGTKLSPTNKCYTKSEATTAYQLNATPTNSYASNQLLPKSAWQGFGHNISFVPFSTAAGACGEVNADFQVLYAASSSLITVGTILYTDANLTTLFNGGNNYYQATGFSNNVVRINTVGVVTELPSCLSYGGTIRLNIPGYGNDVASNPPGSGVISGYTLGSGITIKNIHATQAILFKTASLANPYPILASSGAARLMQYTGTTAVNLGTVPANDSVILAGGSSTWLSFTKSSGSGLVVVSLEYQNSGGTRSQEFWTFNI